MQNYPFGFEVDGLLVKININLHFSRANCAKNTFCCFVLIKD